MSRLNKKTLADLVGDGRSGECRVAGIVTDLRTRRTKKGELMALFTLEDLSGAVETVVFPSVYSKCEALLTADAPILVTGRFEAEDENAFKIIASEVQPLAGAAQRHARTLCIHASLPTLAPDAASQLHRLFQKNRGECGVEVQLYYPDDFRVTIQSSDFVKVKSSPELIREIEGICGSGSVVVVS
jgi:DNA polymerase-3 subunit alpha